MTTGSHPEHERIRKLCSWYPSLQLCLLACLYVIGCKWVRNLFIIALGESRTITYRHPNEGAVFNTPSMVCRMAYDKLRILDQGTVIIGPLIFV